MSFVLRLYFCLVCLVSVSFYTLAERKVISLAHIRQGPVYIRVLGLFQPFSDGLKLFLKAFVYLRAGYSIIYSLTPCVLLLWSFSLVLYIRFRRGLMSFIFFPLLFLVLITFGLFPLLITGYSSNSPWPSLGALRGVAQSVSYEVAASFLLIGVL